jgi:hypothetical protein
MVKITDTWIDLHGLNEKECIQIKGVGENVK